MGAVLALGGYAEQTRAGSFEGLALTGSGPALACANFLMAQDSPWGALLAHPKEPPDIVQECGKGRALQVTFPAQVRDRVRITV